MYELLQDKCYRVLVTHFKCFYWIFSLCWSCMITNRMLCNPSIAINVTSCSLFVLLEADIVLQFAELFTSMNRIEENKQNICVVYTVLHQNILCDLCPKTLSGSIQFFLTLYIFLNKLKKKL